MAFRVDDFISNLPRGGARGNLFEVTVSPPTELSLGSTDNFKFLCQATSIPGGTVNPTTVSYFGREVKFAGTKTFDDWNTTIMNDEDFAIRRIMESWQEAILGSSSNTRRLGVMTPSSYKGVGTVTQFGKSGAAIREYKMVDIWPSAIAEIGLDWGDNDTIQTFDVTWSLSHWVSQDAGDSYTISISTPFGSL